VKELPNLTNIRQSVFGEVAIRSGTQVSGVDLGTLLRRLLLFDTVVLRSVRLREVPFLVRAFGKTGFLQLINSGVLKISCEFTSIITDIALNGVRTLPPFHFSFGVADIPHRDNVLKSELRSLQGIPGLKNPERASMEETILARLVRPPSDYGAQIQSQLESDIRGNTPALRAAIAEQLKMQFGDADRPVQVRIVETQDRTFRVITDLPAAFGISDQKAHDILQPSITGVANLNQRLADMVAYSAITGFTESEAPLLFGKLAGIIAPQNPKPIEEQFGRVITIANLPDFVPGKRIDVESLLKARESPECREFQAWLSNLEGATDAEIAEMVGSLRNRIASIVQSGPGKALRFAVTTALSLVPGAGLIAGPAAGAVDSFLIERVFPTSGVFAFLTKTYPSLFVPS
jgi:hypothetical protein